MAASERYALIVSGAHGEASYADQYAQWRQQTVTVLLEKLGFDDTKVLTLYEGGDANHAASAASVRKSIETVRAKMQRDDLLFILLIGHGSFDGTEAKFNLVGPDLSSVEWGALLKPLPGQVVLVNTTAASFPFLEHLAGPRRVVITATESVAQRFDTVFPGARRSLTDSNADLDKNRRVSIWEAFAAASMGVRRHFTSAASSPPSARSSTTTATASDGRPEARVATARSRAACTWIPIRPAPPRPTRSC